MQAKKGRLPKITFNSPVILSFVFICFVVQVASTFTGGASTAAFFSAGSFNPSNPLTYPCLVTHIFGHVSWEHLFNNMSMILLLGPLLEEKYGSFDLMLIMLASALAASISNRLLLGVGVVGASGVVFTFLLLSSITGLRDGEVPLTFLLVAAFYLCQQLYGAIFVRDNISYLGHISGGVVGAIVGFMMPVKEKTTSGYGLLQ